MIQSYLSSTAAVEGDATAQIGAEPTRPSRRPRSQGSNRVPRPLRVGLAHRFSLAHRIYGGAASGQHHLGRGVGMRKGKAVRVLLVSMLALCALMMAASPAGAVSVHPSGSYPGTATMPQTWLFDGDDPFDFAYWVQPNARTVYERDNLWLSWGTALNGDVYFMGIGA